eukprot:11114851-Alexandrium_andersonii.AAC.1
MPPPARLPPPPPPSLAPVWPVALLAQRIGGVGAANGGMSPRRAGSASHERASSGTLSDEECLCWPEWRRKGYDAQRARRRAHAGRRGAPAGAA